MHVFYFLLKALLVLKILKFLFWLFGHAGKRLDKKAKKKFKTYNVTRLEANNCNTHIARYLKKDNQMMKFGKLIKYNMRSIFSRKTMHKLW